MCVSSGLSLSSEFGVSANLQKPCFCVFFFLFFLFLFLPLLEQTMNFLDDELSRLIYSSLFQHHAHKVKCHTHQVTAEMIRDCLTRPETRGNADLYRLCGITEESTMLKETLLTRVRQLLCRSRDKLCSFLQKHLLQWTGDGNNLILDRFDESIIPQNEWRFSMVEKEMHVQSPSMELTYAHDDGSLKYELDELTGMSFRTPHSRVGQQGLQLNFDMETYENTLVDLLGEPKSDGMIRGCSATPPGPYAGYHLEPLFSFKFASSPPSPFNALPMGKKFHPFSSSPSTYPHEEPFYTIPSDLTPHIMKHGDITFTFKEKVYLFSELSLIFIQMIDNCWGTLEMALKAKEEIMALSDDLDYKTTIALWRLILEKQDYFAARLFSKLMTNRDTEDAFKDFMTIYATDSPSQ